MSRALVIVVCVFLAGAAGMGYGGYQQLTVSHDGHPAVATVLSCQDTGGRYHSTSCRGMWTEGDPVFGKGRFVQGPVDGAGKGDVGHKLDVVVSGDHAYTKGSTTRTGVILLVFAALFLILAVWIPVDQRSRRSKAADAPAATTAT